MHPLPTSSHSSMDSPSLFTVRDFSMSNAVNVTNGQHKSLSRKNHCAIQSPNSSKMISSRSHDIFREYQSNTIHYNGNSFPMASRKYVIQERGLPGTKIAYAPHSVGARRKHHVLEERGAG